MTQAKRQIICRFRILRRKQNLFASDSPYASVPASSYDAAKISACSKGLMFSLRVNVLCLNPQCQTLTRRLVSTDTRLRTSRLARIQVLKSRRKASDFLSQRAHRLQSREIRTSMTCCFLSSSSVACTSEATRSREEVYPQTRTRGGYNWGIRQRSFLKSVFNSISTALNCPRFIVISNYIL